MGARTLSYADESDIEMSTDSVSLILRADMVFLACVALATSCSLDLFAGRASSLQSLARRDDVGAVVLGRMGARALVVEPLF